jgi:hypothetical protein
MGDPYERIAEMSESEDKAERLVASLWRDVTDRRGWRQAADQFDDAIKHDIIDRWLEIARTP